MRAGKHEETLEEPWGRGEETALELAAARLREATEVLESVVGDRVMLRALSVEERTRFLAAAGAVFDPDVVAAGEG